MDTRHPDKATEYFALMYENSNQDDEDESFSVMETDDVHITDLHTNNITLSEGDTFPDWESFQSKFLEFCEAGKQVLTIVDCKTVAIENKKFRQKKLQYPTSHKYTHVEYKCVHYPECPASVLIGSDRKRGVLVVRQLYLMHNADAHESYGLTDVEEDREEDLDEENIEHVEAGRTVTDKTRTPRVELRPESTRRKTNKITRSSLFEQGEELPSIVHSGQKTNLANERLKQTARKSKRLLAKNAGTSNKSRKCSPRKEEDEPDACDEEPLLQEGDTFKTWKIFETKFHKFCKANNHILAKEQAVTVEAVNKREEKKGRSGYPVSLVYHHVEYRCASRAQPKPGGSPRYQRDAGKGKSSGSKNSCPVVVTVSADKAGGVLVLRKLHLKHNHEVKLVAGAVHLPGTGPDLTEEDLTASGKLEEGGTFETWEDFERQFQHYCSENKWQMVKDECKSIMSRNNSLLKSDKSSILYPEAHRFYYTKYKCSHARSKFAKTKSSTKSLGNECPAKVVVVSNRERGLLVLTHFMMDHNHEPDNIGKLCRQELNTSSDLTQNKEMRQIGELREGDTFKTWEEFESQFSKYCKVNHHSLIMADCRKITTRNKNQSPGVQPYPTEHKYTLVKYRCVQGPQRKKWKRKGKNKSEEGTELTPPESCPAQACVTSSKDRGVLVLKQLQLEHNHDVTEPNENLHGDEEQESIDFLDENGQPIMQKGSTFTTWEEFETKFSELCKKHNFQMIKSECHLVESRNRRMQKKGGNVKLYPEEHKYLYIKYVCSHSRVKKGKSSQSLNDSVARQGCQAKVVVSSSIVKGVLEVTMFNMFHCHEDVNTADLGPREDGQLKEGDAFETWSEFQAQFSKFCKKNQLSLALATSSTIASQNKRQGPGMKPYPAELKYMYAKYRCIRGKKQQKKQGKNESNLSTETPAPESCFDQSAISSTCTSETNEIEAGANTPTAECVSDQTASCSIDESGPSKTGAGAGVSGEEPCPVLVYVSTDRERGLVLRKLQLQHNHDPIPYICHVSLETDEDAGELDDNDRLILQRGSRFKTWQQFQKTFFAYCREHNFNMVKSDSETVESRNNRYIKGAHKSKLHPKEHKYVYVRYVCAHFRERNKSPKKASGGISEAKQHCPARVVITSSRERGVLLVIHFDMEHNHELECSEEIIAMNMLKEAFPHSDDWHPPTSNTLEAGHCFKTWEEFEDHFYHFCHTHQQPLVKDDCKLAVNSNKALKEGSKPYPVAHKYSWVKYRCVHGLRDARKRKSNGGPTEPTKEPTGKLKCPASVLVSSDRKCEVLVVRYVKLQHNHDLSLKRQRKRRSDAKSDRERKQRKKLPTVEDLSDVHLFDQADGCDDDSDGPRFMEDGQSTSSVLAMVESPEKKKSGGAATEKLSTVTVQEHPRSQSHKIMEDGNHHSLLCEQLYNLQQKELLCDVLIYIGDSCVAAHSDVVSVYLKSITEALAAITERPLKLCIQETINIDSFKEVIKYMYTGKMLLTPENVDEINLYCVRWGIAGAAQLCAAFYQISADDSDLNDNTAPDELDGTTVQSWVAMDMNLGASAEYVMKTPTKSPKRKLVSDEHENVEAKKKCDWDVTHQWIHGQTTLQQESSQVSQTVAQQTAGLATSTSPQQGLSTSQAIISMQDSSSKKTSKQCQYPPEMMEQAFLAVKESKITVKQAAAMFGVPPSSLKQKLSGKPKHRRKKEKLPVFSSAQEQVLVQHLRNLAEQGYGYYRRNFLKLCTDLARSIETIRASCVLKWAWLAGFIDRWSNEIKDTFQPSCRTTCSPKLVTDAMVQAAFTSLNAALKNSAS